MIDLIDLTLKRLDPEDPVSWGYWPVLERRVRACLPFLDPDAPPEAVVRKLRALWTANDGRLRVWLALRPVERTNGHTPLPVVVAHMVAWVDVFWDDPCLMVYQLEGDPGLGAIQLRDKVFHDLGTWQEWLNARYEQMRSPLRVDLVRFYTTRPGAFHRWFKPRVETHSGGTYVAFRMSEMSLPSRAEDFNGTERA